MLGVTEYQSRVRKFGAHQLCTEDLCDQFRANVHWIHEEARDITESKFSLDMAWFRECWWEMVRRQLVTVH